MMALLGACASNPRIPEALLEPEPKPAVPAPGASDRAVARFILEQDATIDRANAKLRAIAEALS